ncbi:hypothetical protein BST65_33485 [Bradyrhizobium canariense]|nr:hypothetical protein BST65_33485 [Bradyrhizobium canariense]OSI31232.1 hypothetical protein BST66_20105 [Bradyrhizobium canariense]OSI47542.1 hypothetical protein BSZ20_09020 [Bradyrhizobium canariense]OSI49858.1 hypothetical protein BST67_15520 [Bradyrhizobium canariense]
MAGDRTPATPAHRLGHRAAEGDLVARSFGGHCEEPLRRSNPQPLRGKILDCFAAPAMTAKGCTAPHASASTFAIARRSCQASRLYDGERNR